ncbi:MAG: hypothetical protein RL754_328 [Bacteroidota bacterium]|jgi:thiol-disulfide isomerase/thioredoxin
MKNFIISGAISMALFSCSNPQNSEVQTEASQEFVGVIFQNDSTQCTFNAVLEGSQLTVYNGVQEEIIVMLEGTDTLRGTFPVFASDLFLVKDGFGYKGEFFRTDAEDYRLPIELVPGRKEYSAAPAEIPSQYLITRHFKDGSSKPALLQLGVKDNTLVGTIATSTGDTRFLTGYPVEEGFVLEGFDGRFIYHVDALTQGDSIFGEVWAGMGGYFSFEGVVDEKAVLDNPETMSKLREDYTHIEWAYTDLNGDSIHFDSRAITKPTILTIQGSWCPNCMDEGRVLDQFYREFNGAIDIYGLSFEYSGTLEKATAAVQKMARDLETTFPMVIATYSRDQDPNAILPLDRIRSYPTSIILNKRGDVVRIHTGFYGPSTKEYAGYIEETRSLLQELTGEADE